MDIPSSKLCTWRLKSPCFIGKNQLQLVHFQSQTATVYQRVIILDHRIFLDPLVFFYPWNMVMRTLRFSNMACLNMDLYFFGWISMGLSHWKLHFYMGFSSYKWRFQWEHHLYMVHFSMGFPMISPFSYSFCYGLITPGSGTTHQYPPTTGAEGHPRGLLRGRLQSQRLPQMELRLGAQGSRAVDYHLVDDGGLPSG